jgi:glycosyltransferase involved in cell wall biosynthesis
MDAYQRYRASVPDPWPLHCCGTGPEASLLQREGVRDLGYVLPSALPELFADHGVFVMPSLAEPWGVAIGEAAATGLPLVCTEICGAAVDLLRTYYNGITVPPGDAGALADALAWMHRNHHRLRTFGQRGRHLAHPYSAEAWAERLHACFSGVLNGKA